VICFGVGNTVHATSLHPSLENIEVVDTSRLVLEHAAYFADSNQNVISSPRVAVYLNDGRSHLEMQPDQKYDLITLEPPPISHAGVASLYSAEFYELAKAKLKPGGYISQWLPAYQLPPEATRSLIRAFVDAFPQSVLLSGSGIELILLGTTGASVNVDPAILRARIEERSAVRQDLERIGLGTPARIVGMFAASGDAMRELSAKSVPVSDDYPIMEYAVSSLLPRLRMSEELFAVRGVSSWCPTCFDHGALTPEMGELGGILADAERIYHDPKFLMNPL
jgi:spermidine synthase